MSILQNYEIKPSSYLIQPLEHYKGKPDAHGYTIDANRTLTLSYLRPSAHLPDSDVETILTRILSSERKFVDLNGIQLTPISLSVEKAPRSPLSWSVSYLYPSGEIEDYLASVFEHETSEFVKGTSGILNWSIRLELPYEPYLRPVNNKQYLEGYVYGDLAINIEATTDFEISNADRESSVLTEGLELSINQHTLRANVTSSEDTSLKQMWHYSWQFGVL